MHAEGCTTWLKETMLLRMLLQKSASAINMDHHIVPLLLCSDALVTLCYLQTTKTHTHMCKGPVQATQTQPATANKLAWTAAGPTYLGQPAGRHNWTQLQANLGGFEATAAASRHFTSIAGSLCSACRTRQYKPLLRKLLLLIQPQLILPSLSTPAL